MPVFTNIEELEQHLNKKFKGMMKSQELKKAGKYASDIMGRMVLDELADKGASGYDYEQSGSFHKMIATESRNGEVYQSTNSMMAGVFYQPELEMGVDARRNFQTQKHWIGGRKNGRYVTIRLKEENQMPKWIIAEFGMGLKRDEMPPKNFMINYTRRSGKEYLFGPSLDSVGGEGGGNKKGFFMIGSKTFSKYREVEKPRTHPGIRAGRIFSRGLEKSKEEVRDALAEGIDAYLNNN